MKKIVLVIGHTEKSPGAFNTQCGVTEFEFNRKLVKSVAALIDDRCEIKTVYRERYSDLPEKINAWNPDFVICFHANSYYSRGTGTETLFYHKSKKGKEMATIFQDNIVKVLGLKDRGIKGKSSEERGGFVLRCTTAPCLLLEPFFIDNDDDYKVAVSKYPELVSACVDSIYEMVNEV